VNVPVEAIQGAAPLSGAAQAGAAVGAPSGHFGTWFAQELGDLNVRLVQAEQGVRQLAAGEATNLHDVMIRLEEARLSFQLAVQFRARVLEAYQDVMRMQV
jgi:flagellar hook-basal body complex protein FliE